MLEVLIARVVVVQRLLILGALVHDHWCLFCHFSLGVQGGDEGLLGHIFVGHSRGKVLDDRLLLVLNVRDVQVTDPELLALLQPNGFYLLLQLQVQPFLCVLQVLVGLYGICHGDGLADRFVDLQGLFAQVAVVDGNGAAIRLLVGGSIGRGIQSDLAIGFRELLSQHGLDGGFVQRLIFPKGKGVGDGLVTILLGGGVGAVSVLLQVLVDIFAVDRKGVVLQGPGGVSFGLQDLLVEAFVRLLGAAGLGLHGPGGFGDAVEGRAVNLVAFLLQLLYRFLLCLGKSLPSGGFLF